MACCLLAFVSVENVSQPGHEGDFGWRPARAVEPRFKVLQPDGMCHFGLPDPDRGGGQYLPRSATHGWPRKAASACATASYGFPP